MAESLDSLQIHFNTQTLWALNLALALVMFGIALDIRISDFSQLLRSPKAVITGLVSQFVLLPLVTYCLVVTLQPLPSVALGMFLVAACPGGTTSNFITQLSKGNAALSVCLTALATLLAIVMTPLNLALWAGLYPPTSNLLRDVAVSIPEMFSMVVLVLGLPLVLGMLLNSHRPITARKLATGFRTGSLLFFLILVILAFHDNLDIFLQCIHLIFWIVGLHNLFAFLSGFLIAKITCLDAKEVRSITIETGIQNSGLGLLLVFTFFDGLGGMAILVAFWGIWHLVAGMLLALFWARKPFKKRIA